MRFERYSERSCGSMHAVVGARTLAAVTLSVIEVPIGRKAGAAIGLRGSPHWSALMPRCYQPEQTRSARLRNTGSAPERARWELPTGNASASLPERAPQINIVRGGGQGRATSGLMCRGRGAAAANRGNGCLFRYRWRGLECALGRLAPQRPR